MSIYKYKISNYRAIKDANISIEGITVLAGENGTGKSTLSRWLYYIVKVLSGYEQMIDDDTMHTLDNIIARMEKAKQLFRENALDLPFDGLHAFVRNHPVADDMVSKVKEFIVLFGEKIMATFEAGKDVDILTKRFSTLYGFEDKNFETPKVLVDAIINKLKNQVYDVISVSEKKKMGRSGELLHELFNKVVTDADAGRLNLEFTEDGVELLFKDHFNPVLNLNRVIYYKTYELMDYIDKPSDFHTYLETPADKMNDHEKLVYRVFRETLGGEMVLSNDDFIPLKQFKFKRNDGVEFALKQAATGLVSFSYLLRLLENGYLREGTLLIIDEPEAHLHPKWIVEYARMLVMLQKYLRVKMVLSTHNPDMIAAIDAIARKEDVANTTNFYFATPDNNNEYQYNYKKLDSIEDIFDSFNTALIKIQEYGKD